MSSRIAIEQTGRNVICSVVFVDLVEYTRKSVAEQLAIKDRFTELIAEALKDIPVNDRIVLDTGDGAAMSFLGDPEDALFVGMSLRDRQAGSIRVGINLGPVRLVKDINGHPNIVGDGINVAQRIMSFADPGQILASRSYFDVVSCLSDEYARLFSYEGSRTDKHVREHEVYVVGQSASAYEHAKTGMASRATHPQLRAASGTGRMAAPAAAWQAALVRLNEFLRDRRKVTLAGGVLGGLVLLLAATLALRSPAPRPTAAAAPPAAAALPSAAPAGPVAEKAQDAADEAAKAPAPDAAKAAAARPATAPAAAPAAPRVAEAKQDKNAPAEPAAVPGRVSLSIAPWGEVLVDGRSRGVSPPMKTLKLPPGRHTIEIRNTTFKPHVAVVEVKSGGRVTVKHVFK
ncbi:MAG TPA: hypothetical protein VFV84_02000 [Burkholderiales bacterium]|nr:hypothetical protein [Burkholderiales bacterium]